MDSNNKQDDNKGDTWLPILQKLTLLAVMTCDEKRSDIPMSKFYTIFRKVCVKTGSASNVVSKGD
jgi:hypothetical protein